VPLLVHASRWLDIHTDVHRLAHAHAEASTSSQASVPHAGGPPHLSVATRKVPCTETPTPPPMVIPSMIATWGARSSEIRWFRRYSDRKNLWYHPAEG
jgi:hypothetical protein